jgi:transposase InsO family protein
MAGMLQERFGVCERRACVVPCQHRSTQRHRRKRRNDDTELQARLRAMAVRFPRYGYRRIHVMLVRDGYHCNVTRLRRLWRDGGLHVRPRRRRKPKIRPNPVRIQADHPKHVWAIDFPFDETADGRPAKILNVTDEFTREALACTPARKITANGTLPVLDNVREQRGCSPEFLRMDNGPGFIADMLQGLVPGGRHQRRLRGSGLALAGRLH